MDAHKLAEEAAAVATGASQLSQQAQDLALNISQFTTPETAGMPFFVVGLTVFVLACFVGYYVVWRVTPALHSPLMAVTNAISSVIIVGALIAAGPDSWNFSKLLGFLAVVLASVNIFGGFIVTHRMLQMFSKKKKQGA
jgi:H+-translocating NAD(P) transhydrogenase subunit alpha